MRHFLIAALALVVVALTGCQKDETIMGDGVHFTTTVKMADGGTKALDASGNKTFAVGDQIAVIYKNTSGSTVKAVSVSLTSSDIHNDGKVADFSVELNDPDRSQNVTYVYPAVMANDDGSMASIAEQDGTLESLSHDLDYCFYNGSWNGSNLPANVTLANQLAILKLNINDGSSDITANVRQLTVSNGGNTVVVNRTPAAGPIYVAMLPVTTGDIVFVAADNSGEYYTNTFSGKILDAGHLYPITVDLPFSSLYTPLTFEAKTAGATITFTKGSNFSGTVQYSTDGGNTWSDYSSAITLVNVGDKALFRGNNSAYYNGSASKFSCNADCYIYGNIMSLVSSTSYPNVTSVSNYAFREIFKSNTHIKSHDTKNLILPATTLGGNCYQYMFQYCSGLTTPPVILATTLSGGSCCGGMFEGCTGLTSVPEMHVTQLSNYCCQKMFKDCTSLTTIPANLLPATTLARGCYENMFEGCTGLTNVPNLPATSLSERCYYYMFKGCISLTTVPAGLLPATSLANVNDSKGCYESMFQDCTGLTSVPNLPATVLKERCYMNMFRNTGLVTVPTNMLSATTMAKQSCESMFRECSDLTNTPTIAATILAEACCNAMFYHSSNITSASSLPAATLVKKCYNNLFSGCSNLSSITCYATDISADSCTTNWLNGVASTGTFTTRISTDWESKGIGPSGIPNNWTRVNMD